MTEQLAFAAAEEWRDIPGYEGFYEISDLGRVRKITGGLQPKVLKTPQNNHGYCVVHLRAPTKRLWLVHRLVLLTFVGDPPVDKSDGCHNDGHRTNNRLSNLRWDSRSGNQRDRAVHGTSARGKRKAPITREQFAEIRELLSAGVSATVIATEYRVTAAFVYAIRSGKTDIRTAA